MLVIKQGAYPRVEHHSGEIWHTNIRLGWKVSIEKSKISESVNTARVRVIAIEADAYIATVITYGCKLLIILASKVRRL